ncbi:alkaline phosphatase family protein [Cellulomonas sp. 73-92]|uniref:alkaline phosphatase family protein n=1 Tax=Cellulomonas sp. 73-92 TaxID=1895740 RepID=UPI000AAC46AD|nr:alkaline phosphatase family protein [Cellulomonas sp. 73-92]
MSAGPPPVARRRWPTRADLAEAGWSLVATTLGLSVAIGVVGGVTVRTWWPVLLAGAIVAAGALLLAPGLRLVARLGGAGGALVAGLAGQLLVAWAALRFLPGVELSTPWAVVWVLVVAGVVMAVGRWVWAAPGNGYVVEATLRRARRRALAEGRDAGAPGRPPGVLVVQLDGVSAPVLDLARAAGLVPTMDRWLTSGSHTVEPWWARVPATTPASQAGLLHGDSSRVPAFRWWDRDLARIVVANRPADAALIEERTTTGDGLLSGGGVAVGTMLSGDASTAYLVMSRGPRRGVGPGAGYLRFFADPFVLVRALTVTIGEMVKELYQARRQREHGVTPRIRRGGWYVPLRALTNVLLRDLSTSIVAASLEQGAPVVFVALVDYDEIAHHAGPTRPESLRALEGLDGVLGTLERVLPWAPREYEVVVLSDHGQTLGAPFSQVAGASLLDVVRDLMAAPDAAGLASGGGEDFGQLDALLTSLFGRSSARLRRAGTGRAERGRDDRAHDERAAESDGPPEVVVAASGNLALVWFPRLARRPVLEDLQALYPGLVAGLAATPGVGLVVLDTADRGLVVVGPRGVRTLERDEPVEGDDPLAGHGPRAAADLARAARLPDAGDLLVVSAVTPEGQVHAFEGQVGSHGGLGGDQSWAFLLHPSAWQVPDDAREPVAGRPLLVGAEAVHECLLAWLRAAELRAEGAAGAAQTHGEQAPGQPTRHDRAQDEGTPDRSRRPGDSRDRAPSP